MRRFVLLALFLLAGCTEPPLSELPSSLTASKVSNPKSLEAAGLHNLFQVSDNVLSGGTPEGDEGFASLAKLGVKTIVSVDGAKPNADAAAKHGLRYVHLPIGYDGVPENRVLMLAKAARELPGPIYVHCHHGKHRGPAAAAVMQLCTDPAWTPEQAAKWLQTAGTDPRYVGLVGIPNTLKPPTPEQLDKASADFPAAAEVHDLARAMVEIDARWDNLKLVHAAGWKSLPDHPDIDPPHESLQLAEHFREAARGEGAKSRGAEFLKLLAAAEGDANELEQSLRAKPIDQEKAAQAFAKSAANCTQCHKQFRDTSR